MKDTGWWHIKNWDVREEKVPGEAIYKLKKNTKWDNETYVFRNIYKIKIIQSFIYHIK